MAALILTLMPVRLSSVLHIWSFLCGVTAMTIPIHYPCHGDFVGSVVPESKPPGHIILTQLLQASSLLKTVLSIIHDGLDALLLFNMRSPG